MSNEFPVTSPADAENCRTIRIQTVRELTGLGRSEENRNERISMQSPGKRD